MERSPRRPWAGRRVVLGVCGGIAAYKVAQVARDLTLFGAEVDVVLTRSAEAFVGAVTFEGLTGRPARRELVAPGHALDHIRLARHADAVCVAPATADLLARAAIGRSDCLLTAILLATRAPVLLCPAMNDLMWAHAQTQRNASHLRDVLGYGIVGPASGQLAYGEGEGAGRMVEPDAIVQHIGRVLGREHGWTGRRVIVSAGPTREPIDAVRYLSNRSSGRMGFELASAAWRRGADVELISGPTLLQPPEGPRLRRVETAEEMEAAVRQALVMADALIMAAAVADFAPAEPAEGKIKKTAAPDAIRLRPAPDVLAATREERARGLAVMGFALEAGEDGRGAARAKLEAKGMDVVVLNSATEAGAGFEVDTNRVVVIDRAGTESSLRLQTKAELAEKLLDRLAHYLPRRP